MGFFDVNFYSENASSPINWYQITFSALAGTLVGFLINLLRDVFRRNREIREDGEAFIDEISLTLTPLSRQIESLELVEETVRKETYEEFERESNIFLESDRFKSISRVNVCRFFIKKVSQEGTFKSKSDARSFVNQLYNSVEIISRYIKTADEAYDEYHKKISDELIIVNQSKAKLAQLISEFSLEFERAGEDPDRDPFFVELNEKVTPFIDLDGKIDFYQVIRDLEPLVYFLARNRTHPKILEFSEPIRDASYAFRRYEYVKLSYASQLNQVIQGLKEEHTLLDKNYSIIKDQIN